MSKFTYETGIGPDPGAIEKYLDSCDPEISGSHGHTTTFNTALKLFDKFNLDKGAALEWMQRYNQKCEPPWSERDLVKKVNDAWDTLDKPSVPAFHESVGVRAPVACSVTPQGLPPPMADGYKVLLETCFRPNESVSISEGKYQASDGRCVPGPGGTLSQERRLDKLTRHSVAKSYSGKDGLFIRINAMRPDGKADGDVVAFRHVLVESDHVSKEVQYGAYLESRLPIAAILDSGGDSVHAWVKLDAPNRQEWDRRARIVYDCFSSVGFDVDPQNKNPSRYSRCPGVERTLYNEDGSVRGTSRQELLAVNVGAKSWSEWETSHARGLSTVEVPALEPRTSADTSQDKASHAADAGNGTKKQEPDWLSRLNESVLTCSQLYGLKIPPRKAVLGDWFLQGDLGFIFAPRGLGKTWLALYMAHSVASGRACGPWRVNDCGRVLYMDGEMPLDAIRQRSESLGKVGDDLVFLSHQTLFDRFGATLNVANPKLQDAITTCVLDNGIETLFLDNLSTLARGVEENRGEDWELLQPWLLDLRRRKISVVWVHHAGRNPTTMRGHSKREDDVFWIIRLKAANTDGESVGAKFIAQFTKNRNMAEWPTPYEFSFEPNGQETLVTFKEASTYTLFRKSVEDGLDSATDIAEELDVSKQRVSALAKRGNKEGWMSIVKGRYVPKDGG